MPITIGIEGINTNRKLNTKGWEEGFRDYLRHEGREVYKYFEEVSKAFTRHNIVITQKAGVQMKGGDLEIIVGVLDPGDGNRIFSYVNWGTGARMIYPVRYPLLIFRPRYKAATHPGSLVVTPPWTKSGPWVHLASVFNPGIEARRFDKLIQFLMQAEMEYQIRRDLVRLSKKTWV
jgi:hypothetical protein